MTLFDKMLDGLREARKIASPYSIANEDPDASRRALAIHFGRLIKEAEDGRSPHSSRM